MHESGRIYYSTSDNAWWACGSISLILSKSHDAHLLSPFTRRLMRLISCMRLMRAFAYVTVEHL